MERFNQYSIGDHLLNTIRYIMHDSPYNIVHNYVDMLFKIMDNKINYGMGLGAEVLHRKVTNALLKLPVNSSNNFDTVSYDSREDPTLLDIVFTAYDEFIRLEIYKHTGVTYTEWKQLTQLERIMILEHLGYLHNIKNIQFDDTIDELDKEDEFIHKSLYDF